MGICNKDFEQMLNFLVFKYHVKRNLSANTKLEI